MPIIYLLRDPAEVFDFTRERFHRRQLMDIALIKNKYVPFGGGEGYLQTLMEHCVARGLRVHLLTSTWSKQEPKGVSIHRIPTKRYSRKVRTISFATGVCEHLKRNKYDVVLSLERTIGQNVWRGGEGIHRVWLTMRRQFESPLRTLAVRASSFQRAMLALEERCIRSTPYLIANSDMVKRDILSTFPDLHKSKIRVVYNGVDPERYSIENRMKNRDQIRSELKLGDSEQLLLLVGSGFRRKGVLETIYVLRELKECHLVIIGRDNTSAWRRIANKAGVSSRVTFLAPTRDLCPYYHAANAALVPSWYDPFPNVGIESLACGTPVVTTRACGTSDLIEEGVNGSVFSIPSDLAEFLASIQHALAIPGGTEVASVVSELTPEHNLEQTMAILMKASQN